MNIIELEEKALKDRVEYYFVPGVAERHEAELEKLLNDTLRPGCNVENMNVFKAKAEELITKWANESGNNPEEEIEIFRRRAVSNWGERLWPQKRIRAAWTKGMW